MGGVRGRVVQPPSSHFTLSSILPLQGEEAHL